MARASCLSLFRAADRFTRSLLDVLFLATVLALLLAAADLLLDLVGSDLAACAGTVTARDNTEVKAQISQFFFQFACATVQPFRLAESVNKKARKINDLRALYQVT